MPTFSQSPVYNLKAVLKETGLKADVLRAWERRYELPQPNRTPGGHRLYSRYDIETVKWLIARQAEGLSISRAVRLWKESVEAGADPLAEIALASAHPATEQPSAMDTRIEILRHNWLEAARAFDNLRADEILNQAFAIYPVETVCTEILQQGISEIGNDWYLDKASVQQEHFASAFATRRLDALIAATPRPTRHQTVLAGCPPGEQHTLSLLMLTLLLSRRGLKVVYLGADIPIDRLEETTQAIQPDLIVLAAQQLSTAATLRSAALTLQGQGIPLAYGGLVFNRIPRLRELIPATFLGDTLDGAIQQIEQLLVSPAAYSPPTNGQEAHRTLVGLYQEKRPSIEAGTFKELEAVRLPTEYFGEANYFFGNALSAALELGDPDFLEADMEWVRRLITGRGIPQETLASYLTAYRRSIARELGEAGFPITDWVDSYLARNQIAQT